MNYWRISLAIFITYPAGQSRSEIHFQAFNRIQHFKWQRKYATSGTTILSSSPFHSTTNGVGLIADAAIWHDNPFEPARYFLSASYRRTITFTLLWAFYLKRPAPSHWLPIALTALPPGMRELGCIRVGPYTPWQRQLAQRYVATQ